MHVYSSQMLGLSSAWKCGSFNNLESCSVSWNLFPCGPYPFIKGLICVVDFVLCLFITKSEPKRGQAGFANANKLAVCFLNKIIAVYETKAIVLYVLVAQPMC